MLLELDTDHNYLKYTDPFSLKSCPFYVSSSTVPHSPGDIFIGNSEVPVELIHDLSHLLPLPWLAEFTQVWQNSRKIPTSWSFSQSTDRLKCSSFLPPSLTDMKLLTQSPSMQRRTPSNNTYASSSVTH